MAQTTLKIDNANRPAPKWFRKTKKAATLLADTTCTMLLLAGYQESSLLILWLRLGVSGILQTLEILLANGEEYSQVINTRTVIIFILASMLFMSCSSVKKSQRTFETTTDSTRVIASDSSHFKAIDSSKVVKVTEIRVKDSSKVKTTEIVLEIDTACTDACVTDRPLTESDYQDNRPVNKINLSGLSFDIGQLRVKRISFKEVIHQKDYDSLARAILDSSAISGIEVTTVSVTDSISNKKRVHEENKVTSKSRAPLFIQLGILLGLVIFLLIIFYRKGRQIEQ